MNPPVIADVLPYYIIFFLIHFFNPYFLIFPFALQLKAADTARLKDLLAASVHKPPLKRLFF